MNIIDEISEIVRNTPISDVDWSFIQRLNVQKAYEGIEARQEYSMLIATMLHMFDLANNGVPNTLKDKERAVAVMLGAHEDMVRYVIGKRVKERLMNLGAGHLETIELQSKIEQLRTKLHEIEEEFRKGAATKGAQEFKSYLRFAADRWGDADEKKYVEAIINKIPNERKAYAKK